MREDDRGEKMTRKEAIFELRHHLVSTKKCVGVKDYINALIMAIKALEQEPCDDCVSREQFDKCLYELRMNNAYDMPSFWCHDNKDYKVIPTKYNKGYERAIMDIEEKIAKLPSVQPNREKHDEEIIKETVASIWGKPPYTEVLDKIRAEIEQMPSELTADGRRMIRRGSVFRIIDKYREGDKE
jgi:hypothetical protein